MATRYQLSTDRSGSVTSIKTTDTKTGATDTFQGSNIKRARKRRASSSTSPAPPPEQTEQQKSGATFKGQILGKVYAQLTEKEILDNKLSATSRAVLQRNETARRNQPIERLETAQEKIDRGDKLTFSDTEAIATGGKGGGIDLSQKGATTFIQKVDRYNLESDAFKREQAFYEKPLTKDHIKTQTKQENFLESRAIGIDKRSQEAQAGATKRLEFFKIAPKQEDSKLTQIGKGLGGALYFGTAGFLTLDTGKAITGAVDKAVFKAQLSFLTLTGKAPSYVDARRESGRVSREGVFNALSPGKKGESGKLEINPQGITSLLVAGIGAGATAYVSSKSPGLKTTGKLTDVNLKGKVSQRGTTTAPKFSPNIPKPKGNTILSFKEQASGFYNRITGAKVTTTIKTTPTGKIIKAQAFKSKKYVTTQNPGKSYSTLQVYKGGKIVQSSKVPGFNKVQSKGQLLSKKDARLTQKTDKNLLTQQVRRKQTSEINIPINKKYSLRGDVKSDSYTFSTTRGLPGATTKGRADISFAPKDIKIKVKEATLTINKPRVSLGSTKKNPDIFASKNAFKVDQVTITPKGAFLEKGTLTQQETFSPTPQTRFSIKSDFSGSLAVIDKTPKPQFSLKNIGKRGQQLLAPTTTQSVTNSYVSQLSPTSNSFNIPSVELSPSSSSVLISPLIPLSTKEPTRRVSVIQPEGQLKTPDFDFSVNRAKVEPIGKTDSVLSLDISQDTTTRGRTRGKTKNRQELEPIQITTPAPLINNQKVTRQKFNSRFAPIFSTSPKTPQIPIVPTAFNFSEKKKDSSKLGGFNVLTRKGGVFSKINESGTLSYKDAKNFGGFRVENTLRASFKVVSAKESAKTKFNKKANFNNFYTKEEDGDEIFIEKRSKRLNTLGELREIKGAKRKKRGLF